MYETIVTWYQIQKHLIGKEKLKKCSETKKMSKNTSNLEPNLSSVVQVLLPCNISELPLVKKTLFQLIP